jgi:phage pi2 protein 07
MNKIIGKTFLESHNILAKELNLDEEHVIVDKKDYNKLIEYLNNKNISVDDISKIKSDFKKHNTDFYVGC